MSPRPTDRARRGYLEISHILNRAGIDSSFLWETRRNGAPFIIPKHPRGCPVHMVWAYPGRVIPGASLLDAFTRARSSLARSKRATHDAIPAGIMVYNPRGKGVREHLVTIALPDFLELLIDAGRITK